MSHTCFRKCKQILCLVGDSAEKGSRDKKMGFFDRATEKLKRWKNRTPAQQEANKAAQKRYRERKKGQVSELQAQADALAAQVCAEIQQLTYCLYSGCLFDFLWVV